MSGSRRQAAANEVLTVIAAATLAGMTPSTITRWISRGRLPAVLIAGRPCIRPADPAATTALAQVVRAWRQDRQRARRRLRGLQEAARWSQLQLAAASGLTHEAIYELEEGKQVPQPETVRALARAFGDTPQQFVRHNPVGLTTLSVTEAAFRLEVSAGRVRRWLQAGLLDGSKVSGEWRVATVVVAELERSARLRGRLRRLNLG